MQEPFSRQAVLHYLWSTADQHGPLIITDGRGRIQYVNERYLQLTGFTRAQALRRSLRSAMFPRSLWDTVSSGAVWQDRLRQPDSEGRDRWLNATFVPAFDPDGRIEAVVGICSEVTDLVEAEKRYRSLLESEEELLVHLNRKGRITFVNRAFRRKIGIAHHRLDDRPLVQLISGADQSRMQGALDAVLAGERPEPVEARLMTGAGARWVRWELAATRRRGARVSEVLARARDVTYRRQMEAALGASEKKYRALMEHASDAIVLADLNGILIDANRKAEELFGYPRERLLGMNVRELHPESERLVIEAAFRDMLEKGSSLREHQVVRMDGRAVPVEVAGTRVQFNGQSAALGIFRDLTQRREEETRRLYELAYYDGLTGLPNRELFRDRLQQSIIRARREQERVGLLFLDLDRFKVINDSLGHTLGDRLLKTVSERLTLGVRAEDTVARIGGDEFTVILPALHEPGAAANVATKIFDVLAAPVVLDDHHLYISASIGISLFPDDGDEPELLVKHADTAMYRAKETGGNNYRFYSPEMSARFRQRLSLEHELRKALRNGELFLVFQPQLALGSGELTGLEALVRWRHERLGLISPAEFIPVAEDVGMIDELGDWVLRTACAHVHSWGSALDGARVAVNTSAFQLRQPDFGERMLDILSECRVSPDRVELELTESAMMQSIERTSETLLGLNRAGILLTIDDFGTGYSSLSYLKRFAIDKLKIDRSFVRDIPGDPNDAAIASTIIAMGHALSLRVLAEGVETPAQLEFLKGQGCDEAQGFLLGRPQPASAVPGLLAAGVGAGEP